MTFRIWPLAAAVVLAWAAPSYGQEAPGPAQGASQGASQGETSGTSGSTFQSDPLNNLMLPRAVPMAPVKPRSAEADACANAKAAPQARAEACGKLIDSGKWKGEQIAWAHSNRCVALIDLGQTDRALGDCDKAIELDPKDPVAFQARGSILQRSGDSDRALSDFDRAVELGGGNFALFSDRGNLLLARGEADKALADYDKALAADARSATAYVMRGGAWLAKGDTDKALADYAKAIELAPNDGFAFFSRGVAYDVMGDNAKAIEAFKVALKRDPKTAYPGLWLFLVRGGAEAKAELKKASAGFSQSGWPWPVVQYDLGALDAEKLLAAAKTPGDQCEAQFYLGAERLASNAKEVGLTHLRKAAEICPRNFVEYIKAAALLKAMGVEAPKTEISRPKAEPQGEPAPDSAPPQSQPMSAAAPNAENAPRAAEPQTSDKPAEPQKPDAEAKPAAAPQPAPPVQDLPAQGKQDAQKPLDLKPAQDAPADTKPADAKPADGKPAGMQY